ncbi:transmembrane protein [Rhynchospora pubera]|uniref:Transmembrane protein n=1 Tax=Rhynchospora pubera TaxID=906938 RepID=A0AAV8HNY1_9POAL|nr:transmembrane protein [Rhynchospora pubera]
MVWYLPWHLPILPPPILSIFFTLMPPSLSNVPCCSFLHPTVHIPPPLPSYILSHTSSQSYQNQTSELQKPYQTSPISQLLQELHLPKMEFPEFQFEPISFRFYSHPASSTSGSLWTLIAVLAAAAVGFWRIKIGGSKPDGADTSPLFTTPLEETQTKVVPLLHSTENEASVSPYCSVDRTVEIAGTPKVRFTTYFGKEGCIGCCHVEDEAEEPIVDDGEEFSTPREVELSWERQEVEVKWDGIVPLRRRGDLGWYSYQDMAALNGSVVRLWDGDSPRRRKGSIAIPSF